MKNNRMALCFLLPALLALLSSCGGAGTSTIIEMELTQNYDSAEPFVNEKLIYVEEDVDAPRLDASFEMEGESALLEIADNETKEVLWTKAWSGDVEASDFPISLDELEQEREYVVRLTGTGIKYAKIVITSDSSLVRERARPSKPDRG